MSPVAVVPVTAVPPVDWPELHTPVAALEPTIAAPAVLTDANTGEIVMALGRFPGDLGAYRRALLAYPMDTTVRAGGVRNVSRVFGYVGRQALLQRNGCRACGGAHLAPEAHATICDAAGALAAQLAELAPAQAAADRQLVTGHVLADWLMHPDAWWTSGVVNRTSPLPYHYDRNNFDAWSAMVVVRRNVRGGHLHVPAYGIVAACRDGDVVYFNGHRLQHGVTPMRKTGDGYRISAVYYPIRNMAQCGPFAEELRRGQGARVTS